MFNTVRVIGAGLIGTSVALALKSAGKQVEMEDIDQHNLKIASDLVKSTKIEQPDLILIAVPIENTQEIVINTLSSNQSSVVCDLSSVKSELKVEVAKLSDKASRFLSLHPMAGRESSGAESARADLFDGRAWIGIENPAASKSTITVVEELIKICKGSLYWFSADEHDQIVAKLSHLPQILSSALAGELLELSEQQLNIAGQGLRDVTRLAKSNPNLWAEIILQNKPSVLSSLDSLIRNLNNLRKDLAVSNKSSIIEFLRKGAAGKSKIPGKHGAKEREYSYLPIVIDDKPGQLAIIFNHCAQISVNIEDLSIEHSPGQETGLITLALANTDTDKLSAHLINQGFKVQAVKNR